jgi:hypothetical protein
LSLGIPEEAFPDTRVTTGRVSYTRSGPGSIKIEVQHGRPSPQYYIKAAAAGLQGIVRSVSWSKNGGPVEAWTAAKRNAGWH